MLIFEAQGDLAGALACYEEALKFARRLASADPSHAESQNDLSVSLNKVKATFFVSRAISSARSRSTRRGWRSGVCWRAPIRATPSASAASSSVSARRLFLLAQDDLAGALARYEEGLAIRPPAGERRSEPCRTAARRVGQPRTRAATFFSRRAISPARWRAYGRAWRSGGGWRVPIQAMPSARRDLSVSLEQDGRYSSWAGRSRRRVRGL